MKPYVLRYWESEFRWMSPQKSRSKQRLYRRKDIEMVLAIKTIWEAWATGDRLDFRGEFYSHTLMTPMFTPTDVEYGPPRVVLQRQRAGLDAVDVEAGDFHGPLPADKLSDLSPMCPAAATRPDAVDGISEGPYRSIARTSPPGVKAAKPSTAARATMSKPANAKGVLPSKVEELRLVERTPGLARGACHAHGAPSCPLEARSGCPAMASPTLPNNGRVVPLGYRQ